MPGGEEIGDAYIQVHADTRGLSGELKRAARIAAAEFPKAFSDGVGSQMDEALTPKGRRLRGQFTKAGELSGKGWADGFGGQVKGVLSRLDSTIGKGVIFGDWSSSIAQFDDIDVAVQRITTRMNELHESNKDAFNVKDLEAATRQLNKFVGEIKLDAITRDAAALNAEFDKLAASESRADARDRQREVRELLRLQVQDVKDRNAEEDRAFAMNEKINKNVMEQRRMEAEWGEERRQLFRTALEDLIRLDGGIDKFTKNTHANLLRVSKDLRASLGDDGIDNDAFHRAMISIEDDVERGGASLTRLRGKVKDVDSSFSLLGSLTGSRNNFLNAVGIFGGAAEKAMEKLAGALLDPRGVIDGIRNLGAVISENGGGIQGFFSTIGQGISSFAGGGGDITSIVKIALAFTAIGTAVGLAGVALGVFSAALVGLTGIVVALAGSLSFAVAGFLLPLGPIALAAAAGVGALMIAFKDTGKTLDKAVKPVKDWFKTIQDPVRDGLFRNLAADMATFSGTLNNFVGPLLVSSAGALSSVFTAFVQAFQNPDVVTTLATLKDSLPGILINLGGGFTSLLTGILGFFSAIAPNVKTLTDGLAGIAAQFSTWANGMEGQDTIKRIFVEASVSAQALWDLIVSVGGALGTLFDQGKTTGDGFLRKITEIVDEFTTWANSDAGRRQIADWMAFARDLASALAGAVEAVGKMILRLDTPQNRAILLFLIDAFTTLVGWVSNLAAIGSSWAYNAIKAADSLASHLQDLLGWIGKVASALGKIKLPGGISLGNIMQGLGNALTANGGVFAGAQHRIIGEAGPEAVVPLNRPLSMVDPSVRWMSAVMQGKAAPMARGGIGGGGSAITVSEGAVQMVVPSAKQAFQVASSMWDALIAAAK